MQKNVRFSMREELILFLFNETIETLLLIIHNTLLMSSILIFVINKKIDFISIQWIHVLESSEGGFFFCWSVKSNSENWITEKNWKLAEPFPRNENLFTLFVILRPWHKPNVNLNEIFDRCSPMCSTPEWFKCNIYFWFISENEW